ncbi:hypothetical protein [Modestobacter excelsi]|uniref:hypothetical protein n=1 Tax=Modestobacter excelsi TaxID=2213161 RepID=UPI00110D1C84|nr:hypothetical protein [Modestobacter excelsi]
MTREELDAAPALRGRWVLPLALVGALVFVVGFVVELRCAVGSCPDPAVRRLFRLDALGALPRLFTTVLFLAVAVLAAVAAVRSAGRARWWWTGVVVGGAALTVAKAVSSHSALERDDGRFTTLVGAVLLTAIGLSLLWRAGQAWAVPGTTPIVVALGLYAAAAIGLDQITVAAAGLRHPWVALAVATFVEEGGEAVTALLLLVVVSRWVPRRS